MNRPRLQDAETRYNRRAEEQCIYTVFDTLCINLQSSLDKTILFPLTKNISSFLDSIVSFEGHRRDERMEQANLNREPLKLKNIPLYPKKQPYKSCKVKSKKLKPR